eukprot:4693734-Heterocapsa_arctica.AAC.1
MVGVPARCGIAPLTCADNKNYTMLYRSHFGSRQPFRFKRYPFGAAIGPDWFKPFCRTLKQAMQM